MDPGNWTSEVDPENGLFRTFGDNSKVVQDVRGALLDPSGNVCWEGCHGARAGMSRVFLLDRQMDGGGGEQTCPPPDSGPYLGFLSFMRGSQPAYPQPLPASGFGPAVVQLAGAVDYSGPCEEARTPRKERRAKDHRSPNHISKTVPPTVHSSPPNWDRTSGCQVTFCQSSHPDRRLKQIHHPGKSQLLVSIESPVA